MTPRSGRSGLEGEQIVVRRVLLRRILSSVRCVAVGGLRGISPMKGGELLLSSRFDSCISVLCTEQATQEERNRLIDMHRRR